MLFDHQTILERRSPGDYKLEKEYPESWTLKRMRAPALTDTERKCNIENVSRTRRDCKNVNQRYDSEAGSICQLSTGGTPIPLSQHG